MQLYRLDKCGFYRWGEQESEFGDVIDWYRDFFDWLEPKRKPGVPCDHTSTTGERDDVPEDIYCIGAVEDGRGNFGVSLWNKGWRTEDGVVYLSSGASLGNPRFRTSRLDPGDIPGWPSYFWVMPTENMVVSLMPDKAIASIRSFREYFFNFLRSESKYVADSYTEINPKTGKEETRFVYQNPGDAPPTHRVFPRLNVSPEVINTGKIEEIKENWPKVRKFLLHTETVYLEQDNRSTAHKLLDSILLGKSSQRDPVPQKAQMQIEVDWHPQSREEVEEVIEEWFSESQKEGAWAGVKFENENIQHKFDIAKCRRSTQVNPGLLPRATWEEEDLIRGWEIAKKPVEQLVEEAKESRATDRQHWVEK